MISNINKLAVSVIFSVFIALISTLSSAAVEGTLSDNIRIKSEVLGYDLQYRVYIPNGVKAADKLPTLYITDGEKYVKKGRMVHALNKRIAEGRIKPVIAIFVDARDPDNFKSNRRREQFFCKENYASFFTNELVPLIDQTYPTSKIRENRVILGLSFGGFNSGCFGLMATHVFGGIAMNSPANSKLVRFLRDWYQNAEKKHLKIYMSVGSDDDNRAAVRAFRKVLVQKGYELTFKQNNYGHNWNNWTPLLPDVLNTFFKVEK